MSNILKIIIPFFILCLIGIGIGIGCFILKKPKNYILIGIIIIIISTGALFLHLPIYKDIMQQKKEVYAGEYVFYKSTGVAPGTRSIVFDSEKVEFVVPTLSDYIKNMEEGKEYKVTYYVNSRVVYSIELIE